MTANWKPYRHNPWTLTVGTYVKFATYVRDFGGKIGIVKRPITRRNQVRVVCDVDGRSLRMPLTWISEYADSDTASLQAVAEAQPQITSAQKGDFFSEVKVGDWVLMDRGTKKFDVVRFEKRKQSRVYCYDPKTGNSYGYRPEWYVCKVDDKGRLG